MFKKMNFSSPIGLALVAAGVILALSPDARRAIRRFMVKGTAGMMDIAEQVGGVTAGIVKQPTVSWKDSAPIDQPIREDMVLPTTDDQTAEADDTH